MYECLFEDKQFVLKYCNKNVGLGVTQGKLYMLSLNDYALHVSNVSNYENKWKGTRALSFGPHFEGGMERPIKNDVLLPLDF
jgi:hypothetical protein